MNTANRRSCSTGRRGTNRVRAYEGRSGLLYLEYWERDEPNGALRRQRVSLGHHDRERAVEQAKAAAARPAAGPQLGTGEITLGSLFDIYVAEVTPRPLAEHRPRFLT